MNSELRDMRADHACILQFAEQRDHGTHGLDGIAKVLAHLINGAISAITQARKIAALVHHGLLQARQQHPQGMPVINRASRCGLHRSRFDRGPKIGPIAGIAQSKRRVICFLRCV